MPMEAQRVVVIQDSARGVDLSAVKWILQGFSMKPGDTLAIVSVLHQVINPSTLSFMGAGKIMGYKSRVDSSMFGVNQKMVEDEVARKKKEYQNNSELTQISKLYEARKVEFKIEVDAGPSPKVVGVEAAKRLSATWVILDRQMKKDKKYFLEKLSCGISRMKHDSSVEQLRGPKAVKKLNSERRISRQITYDEMLPGSPEAEDLFSIELFPKLSTSSMGSTESSTRSSFSEGKLIMKEARVKNQSPYAYPNEEGKKAPIEVNEINKDHERTNSNSAKDLSGSLKPEEVLNDSIICSICKKKRPMVGCERSFSYTDLLDATNEFSAENLICEGGYGAVFKGELKNTSTVAVKKQKETRFQGENKFKSEMQALEKARHKNVVILLGSCSEEGHRLLVYECICNGSLDNHLSNQSSRLLTWGERLKIALGAARGLNYLHENNIIHRDIRPKNILLTHDHEPVLISFGLARTQDGTDWFSDNCVMGAFGYLAPEYAESGKASTKTDVYAFGVVLLELITGCSTTDKRLEEKSLLGWAKPLFKERRYSELIDTKIVNAHNSYQFISMVQVAEKCLTKDPQKRLSMVEVVTKLEHIMEDDSWCEIDEILRQKSIELRNIDGQTERRSTSREVESCINATNTTYHSKNGNISSATSITADSKRKSNLSTSSSSPPCKQLISLPRTRSKSMNVKLSYGDLLN
ncbi:hypothetical protein LguiB_031914 [Lonicera macranthoides]